MNVADLALVLERTYGSLSTVRRAPGAQSHEEALGIAVCAPSAPPKSFSKFPVGLLCYNKVMTLLLF